MPKDLQLVIYPCLSRHLVIMRTPNLSPGSARHFLGPSLLATPPVRPFFSLHCLLPRQTDRWTTIIVSRYLPGLCLTPFFKPDARMVFLKCISKQVTSLLRNLPLVQRMKLKHLHMAFENFHKLSALQLLPSSPYLLHKPGAPTRGSHLFPTPVSMGT